MYSRMKWLGLRLVPSVGLGIFLQAVVPLDFARAAPEVNGVGSNAGTSLDAQAQPEAPNPLVAQPSEVGPPSVIPPSADLPITPPPTLAAPTTDAPAALPVTPPVAPPVSEVQVPPASENKDRLEQVVTSRELKTFNGKPITLKLRDANLADVFKLIGDASGFNVVLGKGVSGRVTLNLEEVPWDQALDTVLTMTGLAAEKTNNVLRVMTLKALSEEKQEQINANRIVRANTPKITRSFSVNYANLGELASSLQKFSSNLSGATATNGDDPVVIQADTRTSSMIVHDTPKNVEQMRKLIEIMDVPTPQVLIEAKIVEVTEAFSKNLSGSLGIGSTSGNAFASLGGGNPYDALIGSPGVFANGSAIAGANKGATLGFSPSVSFLGSNLRLNALLGIGESDSQVKVMAAPKTVVLNRQKASILSSTPMLTPALISTQMGPQASLVVSQANLSLAVTPTVTNDASVLMDLNVSKDVPYDVSNNSYSGSAVAQRNLQTQVLVESGSTLVIGGIYNLNSTKTSSGFPFIRNIPIIGALFGSESQVDDRSELLIFVTPRILNPKDVFSGGAS